MTCRGENVKGFKALHMEYLGVYDWGLVVYLTLLLLRL